MFSPQTTREPRVTETTTSLLPRKSNAGTERHLTDHSRNMHLQCLPLHHHRFFQRRASIERRRDLILDMKPSHTKLPSNRWRAYIETDWDFIRPPNTKLGKIQKLHTYNFTTWIPHKAEYTLRDKGRNRNLKPAAFTTEEYNDAINQTERLSKEKHAVRIKVE